AVLDSELAEPSVGAAFAAAVAAIEGGEIESLQRLAALASKSEPAFQGWTAAFGWVERTHLQGIVRDLLKNADPVSRLAGLTACAMHRVDPGFETGPWLGEPVPALRARALRAVGELGLSSVEPRCRAAIEDEDAECRFWATWSTVLLGNRGSALSALSETGVSPDAPHRLRAFRLMLQAMDTRAAHAVLQDVARDAAQRRWVMQGSGIVGDVAYVPWLLGQMASPETARAAGEAFTLITGADLDALQLWREQPEDFESGPTENPEDENVDLEPDEGLMWPDQLKVEQWWVKNSSRFTSGQRYFMGAPVTRAHCIDVLKNGYQRQRILAAHYLCLLDPGTPLFNTSAPAWRQQKLLAQMG
ncbi:MAG TPA: TIGR02270 family protein, partial [Vicinamibacterales bacterium]|nr:TIGR02270 family protein [Vicinamibacterales bacterium]